MICIVWIVFITKRNLNHIKKVCVIKDFCNVIRSSEYTKILQFIQNQKSDKASFIIYHLLFIPDPAKILLALGLAWQAALEKFKVKLDLLTDIDLLLIVEKGRRSMSLYLSICKS